MVKEFAGEERSGQALGRVRMGATGAGRQPPLRVPISRPGWVSGERARARTTSASLGAGAADQSPSPCEATYG